MISRMNVGENILLRIATEAAEDSGADEPKGRITAQQRTAEFVTSLDCGRSFATALYLRGVLHELIQQHWLLTHNMNTENAKYKEFLFVARSRELNRLEFLQAHWPLWELSAVRRILKALDRNIAHWIRATQVMSPVGYRNFLQTAFSYINETCFFEAGLDNERQEANNRLGLRLRASPVQNQWPDNRPSPSEVLLPSSVLRAFDLMDEVLSFNFDQAEDLARTNPNDERLYESGGRGVQTSYASLVAMLAYLQLPSGAHIIDLGSGFGRLGFLCGCWGGELRFTGYEFVDARVQGANATVERAGLQDRIAFEQRDLGSVEFKLPIADVYYMYDPFSPSTYLKILKQLNEMSFHHSIAVVTKADASSWFAKSMHDGNWSAVEFLDGGHLKMFRSCRA